MGKDRGREKVYYWMLQQSKLCNTVGGIAQKVAFTLLELLPAAAALEYFSGVAELISHNTLLRVSG